jgi:hypothetical protein
MSETPARPERKTTPCPGCGAPVDCGMANGDGDCWCGAHPPALRVPRDRGAECYCEACLIKLTKGETRARD